VKYDNDPRFKGYYLEDSYVLGIREAATQVILDLLVVLTPEHPDYKPPAKDQQHCYRRATLMFDEVSEQTWIERNERTFTDADRSTDLGNIDRLEIGPGNRYELEGDWGRLRLSASKGSMLLA
jgi:hypothetical protein